MGKIKQPQSTHLSFTQSNYIERKNIDNIFIGEILKIEKEIKSNVDDTPYHIINIFGEAGIGKSTTQHHIIESLIPSENILRESKGFSIKYFYLDLAYKYLNTYSFILKVIESFYHKYGSNDFICTSCALYKLSLSSGQVFDSTLLHQANEHINKKASKTALNFAKSFPLLSNALEIYGILRSSDNLSNKEVFEKFEKFAETISTDSLDNVRSIVRSCNKEIEDNIIFYFAQDLRMIILKYGAPFVFFIDSFDKQKSSTSFGELERPILQLIEELPYVLWVIAGRDCLFDVSPNWKNLPIIDKELLSFSESETKEYIEKAQLPSEITQLFYKLSKGNPLCLKQLSNRFTKLKESNEDFFDESKY